MTLDDYGSVISDLKSKATEQQKYYAKLGIPVFLLRGFNDIGDGILFAEKCINNYQKRGYVTARRKVKLPVLAKEIGEEVQSIFESKDTIQIKYNGLSDLIRKYAFDESIQIAIRQLWVYLNITSSNKNYSKVFFDKPNSDPNSIDYDDADEYDDDIIYDYTYCLVERIANDRSK